MELIRNVNNPKHFIKELMRLTCDDIYGHTIICCHTKLPLYIHTICGVTQLFVAMPNYEVLYSHHLGVLVYFTSLTTFLYLSILILKKSPCVIHIWLNLNRNNCHIFYILWWFLIWLQQKKSQKNIVPIPPIKLPTIKGYNCHHELTILSWDWGFGFNIYEPLTQTRL
jgi:hypothetical protein